MNEIKVLLPEIIGKGYGKFWKFKGKYRVVKGSRASKKSKTTALNLIFRMMKYKDANVLVVRKTYRTLKDSCFAELKWAANRLKVADLWEFKVSPLEITYKPTGQKIFFRGLDDPLKVASITVSCGYLCWLWIEEAYEIASEKDFDVLAESIRGKVPEELFKQITLTFNPWNEGHWLKKRFFDNKSSDILALTTNYMCNEWLDEADKKMFEDMKLHNPRRYNVAGLGNWGVSEGLVYERFKVEEFDIEEISKKDGVKSVFGLDFGYVNDETALFCGLYNQKEKKLYCFDELYKKALTNNDIYNEISKMGYAKEKIYADCAEPKSIDELYSLGLKGIRGAGKGRDSIIYGISFMQDIEIIIKPKCINFINEITNYMFAVDKTGKTLNKPVDKYNHLLDAMRYAMEEYMRGERFSF